MRKKTRRSSHVKKDKIFLKLLLVFTFLSVVIGLFIWYKSPSQNSQKVASDDSLQLGVFYPGEKSAEKNPNPPQPGTACNHDNGLQSQGDCQCFATMVVCKNKKCAGILREKSQFPNLTCDLVDHYDLCNSGLAPTDGEFCIGKPVIYLYPEKPTSVDISIKTSGKVFVSDPQIEAGNTWTNVYATPNGRLTYKGKNYSELFYESNVADVKKPPNGLTLDSENLREQLDNVITKLGLVGDEKTEFLDYWIPKLESLNSKYIFFGIVDPEEKNKVDKVSIDPKPDTIIEFIAYVAPLDKPFEGKTLDLSSAPPERVGFTAVEWGGTVGR